MKILLNRWFFAAASAVFFYIVWMVYFVINVDHPHWDILSWGLIGMVYGPIYMLPTLIGLHRRSVIAIFILNLFLGWTGIGWILAMIFAFIRDKKV